MPHLGIHARWGTWRIVVVTIMLTRLVAAWVWRCWRSVLVMTRVHGCGFSKLTAFGKTLFISDNQCPIRYSYPSWCRWCPVIHERHWWMRNVRFGLNLPRRGSLWSFLMTLPPTIKAVIFDVGLPFGIFWILTKLTYVKIGGVVLKSPFIEIAAYEKELRLPPNYLNCLM